MNFWFILKLQQSDFGRMFLTFSGYNNILAPYSKLDDFISHPPQCPCHPHKKLGVLSLPIPSLALLNVVLNMYTPPPPEITGVPYLRKIIMNYGTTGRLCRCSEVYRCAACPLIAATVYTAVCHNNYSNENS